MSLHRQNTVRYLTADGWVDVLPATTMSLPADLRSALANPDVEAEGEAEVLELLREWAER